MLRLCTAVLLVAGLVAPACGDGGKAPAKAEAKAADVPWPAKPTDGSNMVVEVLSHGKDSAKVRVFNFADKAVESLHLRQHFDDASGKELDTFPFSAAGGSVVGAKAVAEIETVMMGVPAEMKSVRVSIKRIAYAGGETWEAPKAGAGG